MSFISPPLSAEEREVQWNKNVIRFHASEQYFNTIEPGLKSQMPPNKAEKFATIMLSEARIFFDIFSEPACVSENGKDYMELSRKHHKRVLNAYYRTHARYALSCIA